jgi:catechol 2,3-dioxygenase-like lactoylglutathione lyase family enzyme
MAVTGIGGLFFRAHNPEALSAWYLTHLGVGGGEWGLWNQQAGPTVFAPFPADSDYFSMQKQWMLNLRVEGLDALVASLTSAGIEVTLNPEWDQPGVGRFARIVDPEGNPVELWEPEPAES